MPRYKPLQMVSVRLPEEILDRLPAPSLEGHRAAFIRSAIEEKLTREDRARKKKAAIDERSHS